MLRQNINTKSYSMIQKLLLYKYIYMGRSKECLTLFSTDRFEKPLFSLSIKKFPALYGARNFIAIFKRPRQLSLPEEVNHYRIFHR
jgi:hypothetical protein